MPIFVGDGRGHEKLSAEMTTHFGMAQIVTTESNTQMRNVRIRMNQGRFGAEATRGAAP